MTKLTIPYQVHRKRWHESTTSLHTFYLQCNLLHSLHSSRHTVHVHVGSNSYMITFVGNKCFGLMNIGGRGPQQDSRQTRGSFLCFHSHHKWDCHVPRTGQWLFEPTRCKCGCAVTTWIMWQRNYYRVCQLKIVRSFLHTLFLHLPIGDFFFITQWIYLMYVYMISTYRTIRGLIHLKYTKWQGLYV